MSVSNDELERLFERLAVPEMGREYVQRVRASGPSRTVQAGMRNVRCRYASVKLGMTVDTESSVERNYAVLLEYDPSVLEFWEQPEPIDVFYLNKRGTGARTSYTPDFLVIRENLVEIIQVKPADECRRLVGQRPGRWEKRDDVYVDAAASAGYEAMGLPHRVVTEVEASAILAENYSLLMQTRQRLLHGSGLSENEKRAISHVRRLGACTIQELASATATKDVSDILGLIDQGMLFALPAEQRLCETKSCLVAIDRDVLRDVWHLRQHGYLPRARIGPTSGRILSLAQAAKAVARFHELEAPVTPNRKRTLRRWRAELRKADGDILALASRSSRQGNRNRRVSDEELMMIRASIADVLNVPNPPKPRTAYRDYLAAHKTTYGRASSLNGGSRKPVVLNTFLAEIRKLSIEDLAREQGGRRAANAAAPPVDSSLRSLVPRRAFERAHIDHYHADQHVVVAQFKGKKRTKRLWITVMIDDATYAVLAISVSLKAPSRLSCAAVIRECVRRHRRLPESIMVDNGADFQSVYFEVLLARYAISKYDRPPEAPRFGGKIESNFRNVKVQLMAGLAGFTGNDPYGRSVSPSHRGAKTAIWPIEQIYQVYSDYFYETHNGSVASNAMQSPSSRLEDSLETFRCSGRAVAFDEEFVLATAVPVEPLVIHQRGVRTNDRWYWHPDLAMARVGRAVPTMIEPLDKLCVYVLVGERWLTCLSGDASLEAGANLSSALQSIVELESKPERAAAHQDSQAELGHTMRALKGQERNFKAKRPASSVPKKMATVAPMPRRSVEEVTPFATFQASWNARGRRP